MYVMSNLLRCGNPRSGLLHIEIAAAASAEKARLLAFARDRLQLPASILICVVSGRGKLRAAALDSRRQQSCDAPRGSRRSAHRASDTAIMCI